MGAVFRQLEPPTTSAEILAGAIFCSRGCNCLTARTYNSLKNVRMSREPTIVHLSFHNFVPKFPLVFALVLLVAASVSVRAQTVSSDSERLQKLERAVELLQQRNADLEREVSSLKKAGGSAAHAAPATGKAIAATDGKSVATRRR